MKELFQKKWVKTSAIAVFCVICVYLLIFIDVTLRARSAYLEGEKYFSWYQTPALKEKALADRFEKDKAVLDKKLAKNKITKDEHGRQLEVLGFDHAQQLKESSIKYAYIWYQTVVELFNPPESKWVKLSRTKMLESKELWKKELTQKGVKFEDYMLE